MTVTVEKQKHFVQREGGEFQRQQFQIAASQEAFRILSDGLYSDKIRAVIRELSTNAVDSHVVAGNDGAFEVHLPSYDEPWFSVRDYGTGLSHDEVMSLYSTYFGTNKADNLATTGCLGLGSKSPLAKVRSFTVISRHNGMEKHYIIALNEDRIPEVNYLPEQDKPTTDTGMEIKMAVSVSDIREYANKAAQVYMHFDESRRPRILNCPEYKIPEREVLIEGSGWRMLSGRGTPMAIMGNVGYPIAISHVNNLDEHQMAVLQCNIEIDFPIGSLAFTPSREHLSYNKLTCEALAERLNAITAEVNKTISTRFDNCRSLWEARCLAWSLFWSQDADLRHLQKLADTGKIMWNGQKIAGKQLSFSDISGVEGWSFELTKKSRNYWSSDVKTTVPRRDRHDYTPRENVVWCEVDIPRGSYSRCQYYVREHENALIYLVSFDTPQARQEFCDKMGLLGDEFLKTSSLPKPPSAKRSGGKIHRSSSLAYKHSGSVRCSRLYQYWEEVEIDLDNDDGGIYVEMKHNKVVGPDGKCVDPGIIGSFIKLLTKVTGEEIAVIGVRPQVAKKFRKSDDWVDLCTYIRNVVKINVVQNNLGQHIVNAEALSKFNDVELWVSLYAEKDNLGDLDVNGSMYAFIEALGHMLASKDACPYYSDWRRLMDYVNFNTKCGPERDLNSCCARLEADYPLLASLADNKKNFYGRPFKSSEVVALRHYVNLVESA